MDGPNVLIVNASYRADGTTDQVLDLMASTIETSGGQAQTITLRHQEIKFCLNCRACTQHSGPTPGQCVHDDAMTTVVAAIEHADAYILATPTNFGGPTALFSRFLERLIVYAYWPWGAIAPRFRKAAPLTKEVLLVSSSAAPGLLARWSSGSLRALKQAARAMGAKPVGTLFTGQAATSPDQRISAATKARAEKLALRLVATQAG